jgi:hypothetical protein
MTKQQVIAKNILEFASVIVLSGWTQNEFYDTDGLKATEEITNCFCALGALHEAKRKLHADYYQFDLALRALEGLLPKPHSEIMNHGHDSVIIPHWNDHLPFTHESRRLVARKMRQAALLC